MKILYNVYLALCESSCVTDIGDCICEVLIVISALQSAC